MSFPIQKEDLRSIKTKKSLNAALSSLLLKQSFKKITVGDICEEAILSRATFYAHYSDKYHLFRYWLETLYADVIPVNEPYEVLEQVVNKLIRDNETVLKNVIKDADSEVLDIIYSLILSRLNITETSDKTNAKQLVLSNFIAGGLIYYLTWNVNNKYPIEVMNTYLHEMVTLIRSWGTC